MARIPLGQTITIPITVKDGNGNLINADGGIVLTVQNPDATTTVFNAPSNLSTGLYQQIIPVADTVQLGHYQWTSVATVAGSQGVGYGEFDVFNPFEVNVLSLQDAKDALRIPQTNTASDTKILRKMASIETDIERVIGGPIITRQITERVELTSGYTALCLRYGPVVSVVSITSVASGGQLSIADMEIDNVANIVRRKLGLPFYGPYFTWMPIMTVVYTAGLGTTSPASIAEAAELILQHQWATQTGGAVAVPGMGGQQTTVLPGMGYAIPMRAAEKLAPFTQEAYV